MVSKPKQVAMVFMTKMEEGARVLSAIARYNRFHDRWTAFVDDDGVSWGDPGWLLDHNQWDGVICKHYAPGLFKRCLDQGIPCVDLSDHPDKMPGIPKIRPDNAALGQEAAEYFHERGYHTLGFCGFATEHWSRERGDGCAEAARQLGLDFSCLETAYPDFYHGPVYNQCGPGWDNHEKHLIMEWLRELPRPAGILCCNDMRALQVMESCRALSIHVPGEVAIMGANNESYRCELSQPQLSSIGMNTSYYGETAARVLSEMMAGADHSDTLIYVDPLAPVTRQSTDFSHIDDRTMVEALNIIWHSACKGITVDEVAAATNVSRSLLERKFRKFLGRSPQAEIRNLQLKQIKQLLTETDYTLDVVAELAGYQHTEYLHAVFKKSTNMTPKQYRMKFRKPVV